MAQTQDLITQLKTMALTALYQRAKFTPHCQNSQRFINFCCTMYFWMECESYVKGKKDLHVSVFTLKLKNLKDLF